LDTVTNSTIAVVGGTGPQGKGLAYRFAKAGHSVIIGSRGADRAIPVAQEIVDRGVAGRVTGADNNTACAEADIVLLAIPYDGHDDFVGTLAAELADKIVISCVNPLGFDKRGPYGLDVERSAAEAAAAIVPTAKVTGAFHHVAAASLWSDEDFLSHEDVLVCGDDVDAVATVVELAAAVTGKPGVRAGALRLARQLEPLTAVLISINKAYKTRSGIAISGI